MPSNDPQRDECRRPTCAHTRANHSRLSGCLVQEGPGYCSCQGFVEPRPQALDAPETPYAGTSGWSGSDTSRDRAETEDGDGTTHARQARVLEFLDLMGINGGTWRELATYTGWHHGQASGALSVLHKVGRVARLTDRRDRCQVYVLPGYVHGRETADHGRKRPETLSVEEVQAALRVREGIDLMIGRNDYAADVETVLAALERLA